jgi:hypothetical protein
MLLDPTSYAPSGFLAPRRQRPFDIFLARFVPVGFTVAHQE